MDRCFTKGPFRLARKINHAHCDRRSQLVIGKFCFMTPESLFSTTWNDASENEETSYRRLSVTALIAFFLGILSFVIYFSVWFFFIAVIGIVLALIAVWLIRRSDGLLSGIGLAHCGLALSIISLVSVSVLWPYYIHELRLEGNRFFRIWLTALQTNNLPLAKGMGTPYWERSSIDNEEKWWKEQYADKWKHRGLHGYTDNKLVRTLLALGEKADITYDKTLAAVVGDGKDTVVSVYAVTYPTESGEKETFFIKMTGVRQFPTKDIKNAGWSLDPFPELYVPEEYKKK